jgi:hypothetical protein
MQRSLTTVSHFPLHSLQGALYRGIVYAVHLVAPERVQPLIVRDNAGVLKKQQVEQVMLAD